MPNSLPMPKTVSTLKGLRKLLESHIDDAPNALSVKLRGTTHNILNGSVYVGTVVGDDYAAVMIGGHVLLLEFDRSSASRAVKAISEPDAETISKIAKALLPEPEPPAEVKAANEALSMLPKLPKGWRYALDGKGNLAVVEDGDGRDPMPKPRAPRGSLPPKEAKSAKPAIVKGLKLIRKKTGVEHKVTSVDVVSGYVVLKPSDGSEDYRAKALKGGGSSATYSIFWANWSVVV